VLQVQQGSLLSRIASENGRQAKFYSLSKAGRKQLDVEASNWNRLSEAVAMILLTAE
jgi:PadR family transcriptional regulator